MIYKQCQTKMQQIFHSDISKASINKTSDFSCCRKGNSVVANGA